MRSASERMRVIAPGRTYVDKQGFTYGAGASAETVGADRICMSVLPMPPGKAAEKVLSLSLRVEYRLTTSSRT